jgi:hypothetical protein
MRDALKLDLFRILSKNGFTFTNKEIDAFAERLEGEQFNMDESGSFWSPSGESLVTAVYRLWAEGAPAASPTAKGDEGFRESHGGYSEEDFDKLSNWDKHAILEEAKGAPPPPKDNRPAPVSRAAVIQFSGLSAADYDALPLQRRLELENAVKAQRGDYGSLGHMAGV